MPTPPLTHRYPKGTSGNAGPRRSRGAKALAAYIMKCTDDGEDLVRWCLALWRDVNAPVEWRWKAFEWLANRGAGSTPNLTVLNVTQGVNSERDLRSLSTEDLEKIDQVFRARALAPAIDITGEER